MNNSRNLEHRFELLDESPFVHRDIGAEEFLQRVDTRARDVRVQHVRFFEVTAIQGLVVSFDLDSHGRLALLADRDGLVLALDGYTSNSVRWGLLLKGNKLTLCLGR